MRKNMSKEVKGLVKEENGKTLVYVGGRWVAGGKDDKGAFFYTKCTFCGGPVRQYLGKRGPKRLRCDSCSTSLGVKVEGNKVITRRGVLELIEE
jgi:ribosomal protein S27E